MWKTTLLIVFCRMACLWAADGNRQTIGIYCDDLEDDCLSIPNAVCNEYYECECQDRYIASPNNQKCLRLANETGEDCEISEQCRNIESSAACLDNICVVVQGSMPTTEVPPVTGCRENGDCTRGVCQNGTCFEAGVIMPKTSHLNLIGKPCSESTDCHVNGSACIDGTCKCTEDLVSSLNLKLCLPKIKSVDEPCTETTQCVAFSNTICFKGKCSGKMERFLPGLKETFTNLFKWGNKSRLLLGSTCEKDDECKNITDSVCRENICECADNFIPSIGSDSCLEKAEKEGDPCDIDKQCEAVAGAFCSHGKCLKFARAATGSEESSAGPQNQVHWFVTLAAILYLKVFFNFN